MSYKWHMHLIYLLSCLFIPGEIFLNQWCNLEINNNLRSKKHHIIRSICFLFPESPPNLSFLCPITIILPNHFCLFVLIFCILWTFSQSCPLSQNSIFYKVDLYPAAFNLGFHFVKALFSFCVFLALPFIIPCISWSLA